MYSTMSLSAYKKSRYDSSRQTRKEPNLGCLLLEDDQDESLTTSSCIFSRRRSMITTLPFPQNTFLTIYPGDEYSYALFFVPVINQPLSSNRYYVMYKYQGEALRCATLEDQQSCCFVFTPTPSVDPRPLDPEDIYQQFQIQPSKTSQGYFNATCVASDGIVPQILRNPFEVEFTCILPSLCEVKGIDSNIRDLLPKMSEPMVVGKWYCPFMFIKDIPMKDQVKRSLFYEMTLERRWERIFSCQNSDGIAKKSVDVDVVISTEEIRVAGEEVARFEEDFVDGFVWFNGMSSNGNELPNVGLSSMIVERMIWEQERVGWIRRNEKKVRIRRSEKYEGDSLWLSFECFVLVERFVLKRMDGSLVLEYDFRHNHDVKIKWG